MPSRRNWTEDETILAFYYYCQIPFGQIHTRNPSIKRIATLIGRTPGAVVFKMGNLGHYDPALRARNVVGLEHGSRLDESVVEEFLLDWEGLSVRAKAIEDSLSNKDSSDQPEFPIGSSTLALTATRVHQQFFRNAVLSAFQNTCCITGITEPSLLIASHIKPWSVSDPKTERTNPCNGLCLNALHDKAFDRGLITVLPDFTIRVSSRLLGDDDGTVWLRQCDKQTITLPHHFFPETEFLQYHNDVIFVP